MLDESILRREGVEVHKEHGKDGKDGKKGGGGGGGGCPSVPMRGAEEYFRG